MTTDQLAAIVAAATQRAGWQLSKAQGVAPAVLDENLHLVACEIGRDNAEWTANAPRTILDLAERIRELEAQRDALQAHCAEFVELRSPDESPPVAYANEENKRFRFESCEQVEAIVRMPLTKQMRFGRGNWEGRTEIEWQGGNSPFFGFRIEHGQVVGWKPLPKP